MANAAGRPRDHFESNNDVFQPIMMLGVPRSAPDLISDASGGINRVTTSERD